MINNYMITIESNKKNITSVILAISQISLNMNRLAGKLGNIIITPLSVKTQCKLIAKGEILVCIKINIDDLKNEFLKQLDVIIDNVSKKYHVEIDKKELL